MTTVRDGARKHMLRDNLKMTKELRKVIQQMLDHTKKADKNWN